MDSRVQAEFQIVESKIKVYEEMINCLREQNKILMKHKNAAAADAGHLWVIDSVLLSTIFQYSINFTSRMMFQDDLALFFDNK